MTPIKKGIWFVFTAVGAMTMMVTMTTYVVLGATPTVLASDRKNHENKNFNSFPIDSSEREFDDWLS
jgi:hypothetical protein